MRLTIIFLWKICCTLATQKEHLAPLLPDVNSSELLILQNILNYQKAQKVDSLPPLAPITINFLYSFSAKLFHMISPPLAQTNLIFSPLSLQTMLSFIYTGAENETAKELSTVLELPEMPGEVARKFQAVLKNMQRQISNNFQLEMANKLYYGNNLKLNYKFYNTTIPYFNAEVEQTNFRMPEQAAYKINQWAAERTNQRILNLIPPKTLDADTKAIVINAIYLKANWAKEFSTLDTQRSNFAMTPELTIPVDMMFIEDNFNFSELPALNAKVIELPFEKSDLSMLILLPSEIDGLAKLETELNKVDLNSLMKSLRRETVLLRLPKFRIDFELDMSESLKKLGLTRLFSDHAQLNSLFNNQTVRISKVQHKAYINVNEGGVEAAAASFGKLVPLSLPTKINKFIADHPFMFIICNSQAVYFMGHVVNP